ncbi:hypothetical protein GC170_20410 [bacterium]|nr:hypothetical protein [bacterium]
MIAHLVVSITIAVFCGQVGRVQLESEIAELSAKAQKQTELLESLKKQGRSSAARDKARAVRVLNDQLEKKRADLQALKSGYGVRLSDLAGDDVLKEVVFDLPSIAGRSPDEVVRILGKPSKVEETANKGQRFQRYLWKPKTPNGSSEFGPFEHSVVFVNGKADWITIAGTGEVDYDIVKAFRAINVPPGARPTVISRGDTRWEDGDLPGYRYLSIRPSENGKVSSILVRVFTEP